MSNQPAGQRRERLKTVMQAVLEWGLVKSKAILTAQWEISDRTWRSYLDDVNDQLRAAVVESAIDVKSKLVTRLETLYSKPGTSDKTKLGCIAQLAKLHGAYAPMQIHQTNTILAPEIQAATSELIDDGASPVA